MLPFLFVVFEYHILQRIEKTIAKLLKHKDNIYMRRLERKAYLPPTANTAMQATTVSRGNNRARRGLVSWLLATVVTNMIEVLCI